MASSTTKTALDFVAKAAYAQDSAAIDAALSAVSPARLDVWAPNGAMCLRTSGRWDHSNPHYTLAVGDTY